MKKLVTLLLAAGLVFSAANSASAVEVKVSGVMDFAFDFYQNLDTPFESQKNYWHNHGEARHQYRQGAVQRFRVGVDFIVSESLRAHYQMQVGEMTWGGPDGMVDGKTERNGGRLGGRSVNASTRFAYLDWIVPNTDVKVRMGLQPLLIPFFTYNTPVLDDSGTGIVVSVPVNDNIGVTAMWVRAASDSRRNVSSTWANRNHDNLDVFGLIGDFKYDGYAINLWGLGGSVGSDAIGDDLTALTGTNWRGTKFLWMAGIGGELTMFDPFRFTADFYYGSVNGSRVNGIDSDRSGWYAALGAEYNWLYGTLGLKGWYASGDDNKDSNGSERAPSLSASHDASSTFWDGRYSIGRYQGRGDASGTWGITLAWNDISFIDKVSHDLSVTYTRGTNSAAMARTHGLARDLHPMDYLTKGDAFVEVDFNTTYNIYQNLAAVLELAYIFEDFNTKTWGDAWLVTDNNNRRVNAKFSDMWRAALNFRYSF